MREWTNFGTAVVEKETGKFIGNAADKEQASWIAYKHNESVAVERRMHSMEV